MPQSPYAVAPSGYGPGAWGAAVDGVGPYPPGSAPESRRTLVILIAAACAVVLVVGVVLAKSGVLHGDKLSTTKVTQSTAALAGGQTRVTDAKDGLSFVLPKGWSQAPTSPSQFAEWIRQAKSKIPGMPSLDLSQITPLLNHLAFFGVRGCPGCESEVREMMVLHLPQELPELDDTTVQDILSGIRAQKVLSDVQGGLAEVDSTPAVRATVVGRLAAASGAKVSVYGTVYIFAGSKGGMFWLYYYAAEPGDPSGDLAAILSTLRR